MTSTSSVFDVATGKRTALVDFAWPRDWRPAPLLGVRLADDPRTYAYTLYINDSELFTVRDAIGRNWVNCA